MRGSGRDSVEGWKPGGREDKNTRGKIEGEEAERGQKESRRGVRKREKVREGKSSQDAARESEEKSSKDGGVGAGSSCVGNAAVVSAVGAVHLLRFFFSFSCLGVRIEGHLLVAIGTVP